MCLLTHPDKNMQSSAADGAFKLVVKAWSILSITKSSGSKDKKAEEKRAEQKKAEEAQEKKAKEKKAQEKKTEEKKAQEKKAQEKKAQEKKAEAKKAEGKKAEQRNTQEKKAEEKKAEGKKAQNWENIDAKIRCQKCKLLHIWCFSRMNDNRCLYHYCKKCSSWCVVGIRRAAKAEVPLNCGGCDHNLSWGNYRPFAYDCSNCGCYYIAGVDPNWIPKSQDKGSYDNTSYKPETVSCPFCGSWGNYVIDQSNKCKVRCRQCGLRSIVQIVKAK